MGAPVLFAPQKPEETTFQWMTRLASGNPVIAGKVLGKAAEMGMKIIDQAGLAKVVGAVVANAVDLVFCCGPLMRALWRALPASRRGGYAEDSAALEAQVLSAIRAGDVVMVKGSLGSSMGIIVKALQRLSARRDGLETLATASVQG